MRGPHLAPDLTFREATIADAETMARTVGICFDGYRAFAPLGWEPPPLALEIARIRERFERDRAWAQLAFNGDEPAGQVGFTPDKDPATAYLWQLFVRPAHWGTGLADRLHAVFLAEARARGYERGRLLTPAAQARARRFYERNGWRTDGVATFEPALGLDLVVYTRAGLT